MYFIDTHTHLYQPDFSNDLDDVVNRAVLNGVRKFLLPNIDSSSIIPMMKVCDQFPENCYPMMGLHPTSVRENFRDELQIINNELHSNKTYIGVGEIGIDLYWDKTFFKQQQEAFRYQLELAKTLNLPVVIHARNSFWEIFEILDHLNDDSVHGVFHSFSGNDEEAEKALSYGFYVGIGGIVTFKNSGLDEVVKKIPMERILLETDSPYLSPTPNRGKRNESAYLRIIAEKISNIHGVTMEQVAEITSKNAVKLFKINNI